MTLWMSDWCLIDCLIGILLYILNVIKSLSALIKLWQICLQSLHYITLMMDDTSESEDLMNVCMCNIVWKSIQWNIITITLLITLTNWRLFREQQNDQSYSAATSGYAACLHSLSFDLYDCFEIFQDWPKVVQRPPVWGHYLTLWLKI